jgi:hypothetical protein
MGSDSAGEDSCDSNRMIMMITISTATIYSVLLIGQVLT